MKIITFIICGTFLNPLSYAKEVNLAIGLALPPYVLVESRTGIELDIVREALALVGHELKPKFVPLSRLVKMANKYDGAMTLTKAYSKDLFFSKSHITYQNIIISLKSKNITVSKISDLQHVSCIAFQNAHIYLGDEYNQAVSNNKNSFIVESNQKSQVKTFYKGRVDTIAIDINIFTYYKNTLAEKYKEKKIVYHELFPPNHYLVGFKNSNIRDDFNRGLQQLKDSGRYSKIKKEYLK